MESKKPSTVAEINDLIRSFLPEVKQRVETDRGTVLVEARLSEKVTKLLEEDLAAALDICEAIRTYSNWDPEDQKRESGQVVVDGEKYFWKFEYFDRTGFFTMPNGDRVLRIWHESER